MPTINGDGKQSRDFTYIDDIVEGVKRVMKGAPEKAVGQDPLAELVKIDPKSIGVGQYQHDMKQARLTEALGVHIEPHFGPDRKGDIKHSNADISKARRLLGYDPDYSFKDGIKLAIEWYKENL